LKEEKKSLKDEKKQSGEVSRRDFLVGAGTVVVGGAIGAGLLSGCVGEDTTKTITTTKTVDKVSTVTVGEGTPITVTATETVGAGQTVTSTVISTTTVGGVEPWQEPEETTFHDGFMAAHGFGGAPASYDSKNGKLVRIRPFHYDWKYPDHKVWTREARGKVWTSHLKTLLNPEIYSYKQRVYNSGRILYPLQRVDWEPGGDPAKINPQNRGISKFKRISWDEAAEIVASELTRIQDKYGVEAVLPGLTGHGETKFIHNNQLISQYLIDCQQGKGGQYTNCYFTIPSAEASIWGGAHVWGSMLLGMEPQSGVIESVAANTEMILEWASDTQTKGWFQHGATVGTFQFWWRDLGIKAIYICPDLNTSASILANKWIPVIPNTDAALFLAIANIWIAEDTYDKEYIATHTYGFDKFKAYVMGDEDGVSKTPAWASPICGVPVWTIKALAREWASKVTALAHAQDGGSISRGVYATEPKRLEILCLAMQGLGKPGVHQIAGFMSSGAVSDVFNQGLTAIAAYRAPSTLPGAEQSVPKQILLSDKFPECILNSTTSWYGKSLAPTPIDQMVKYEYPAEGCSRVHMIWFERSYLASYTGGPRILEAYRSPDIEFNLRQEMYFEGDSSYADIILPINTQAEEDDINYSTSEYESLYVTRKALEPLGESLADDEACQLIARKLGVEDTFTQGRTNEQWIEHAFNNSNAQDEISWEEFNEKGYFVRPYTHTVIKPLLEDFYENPEGNPLMTPSGLIEFEAQYLAENFPDDKERAPVPHYVAGGPASEGWTHDESLSGERGKMYPLVCESSPPKFRIHSMSDDVAWMREIYKIKGPDGYMYEPCWLHPTEADTRGLKNGDIVKVFNERAAILCGLVVTERVAPKSVHIDKGAKIDLMTINFDRGGCTAMLAPEETISANTMGYTMSGYLVEVEGADLEALRKEYPEAFARDYDPAHGVSVDAWVEGGMV
jgi:trimethylamine-N-oxide reductase (cytochrome c)